ncbi:cell division protein FtsQ/DivIB [Poriferisphaera sp. WC338]|uniref:cell division protein FtsQ/DivIB n=1 Tax=Poriferisphaera sp. WC338 TaxID=3425129 RepID=UPI003D81BF5F
MGWLLTKNSGKQTKKKTTRGKSASPSWDPQRTLLGLKACGGIAIAIALVFGWHFMEMGLDHYAANKYSEIIHPEQITLDGAPTWMSGKNEPTGRQLTAEIATLIDPNPLDGSSLRRAVDALNNNPNNVPVFAWIKHVSQIRRFTNNSIQVTAEFREPVALIITREGYRSIDAEGVTLPDLFEEHQVKLVGLPVIGGVPASTEPYVGQPWSHSNLHAGLQLAMLLRDEPYIDQVRMIDVSPRDARGRLELVLRTYDNGAVVWGRPPGQEDAIEESAATKCERLRALANNRATNGRIDAGGQIVNIYGPNVRTDNTIGQLQAQFTDYKY